VTHASSFSLLLGSSIGRMWLEKSVLHYDSIFVSFSLFFKFESITILTYWL